MRDIPLILDNLTEAVEHAIVALTGSTATLLKLTIVACQFMLLQWSKPRRYMELTLES